MKKSLKFILIGIIGIVIGFVGGRFIRVQPAPMDHSQMGMGDQMSSMTTSIKDLKGDEFDKKFLEEMIVHHQGAVDMARLVLKNSQREELKALASDIVSAQTKEISMMKEWLKTWFAPAGTKKK
ncbi:MAG TPA: DUF305 domain-containing protein [Candidatus Paceibacterota bacterium]